ncbi:hypothetical protein BDM02DRAFT_723304 [Thelephora ganbajun]|uniref:Uncharacterized protein n=1 Tax=Thelephora ganbajun TaxID=370292 RepID=A0ACB6Z681_THEGA|nr:hypothetical protein BDM02DRAFT_723304 [Thelephora ganbajun]
MMLVSALDPLLPVLPLFLPPSLFLVPVVCRIQSNVLFMTSIFPFTSRSLSQRPIDQLQGFAPHPPFRHFQFDSSRPEPRPSLAFLFTDSDQLEQAEESACSLVFLRVGKFQEQGRRLCL